MSDFGECIGQLLFHIIVRCMLTALVIFIDRQIVARRDVVVRYGRKTQNFFRLPHCMHVFADTDPGMLDGDIRMAAEVLFLAGLTANAGLSGLFLTGSIWNAFFWMGTVISTCIVLVLWLVLAHSRRRLLRSQRSFYLGSERLNKESGQLNAQVYHGEGDPGVRESIRRVWSEPVVWLIV